MKKTCSGCIYDPHTSGMKNLCSHPDRGRGWQGVFADPDDYSCYKPVKKGS